MTEKHGDIILQLFLPKVIGVTLFEFWTLDLKSPSCSWDTYPNAAMSLRILG